MTPEQKGASVPDGDDRAAAAGTTCRALVVAEPRRIASSRALRPAADFVTQLIACARQLPPYRRAGRAQPDAGSARYRGGDDAPRRVFDRIV